LLATHEAGEQAANDGSDAIDLIANMKQTGAGAQAGGHQKIRTASRSTCLAWGWDPFAGDILKRRGLSWGHRMILGCRDGTFAVMDVALVVAVGALRRDFS
jgi:hypothetical protein